MRSKLIPPAVAGVVVGLLALCIQAHAQIRPASTEPRVSVTLALVDRLPHGEARFMMIRRPISEGGDVILLPSSAGPSLLTEAVSALLTVRRQSGDRSTREAVLRVVRAPAGSARELRPLPWAGQVIADLHRAPRKELRGVGSVPSIQIWLPAQQGG